MIISVVLLAAFTAPLPMEKDVKYAVRGNGSYGTIEIQWDGETYDVTIAPDDGRSASLQWSRSTRTYSFNLRVRAVTDGTQTDWVEFPTTVTDVQDPTHYLLDLLAGAFFDDELVIDWEEVALKREFFDFETEHSRLTLTAALDATTFPSTIVYAIIVDHVANETSIIVRVDVDKESVDLAASS